MSNNRHQPPSWANRFLEWFCHPDLLEEIQGDAYELFEYRLKALGTDAARRRFAWDVLRSFRLSTIRNFDFIISPDMLKINARIAIRQMLKQKVFSFIKIGGFALGMAACLLIGLYIHDELSFDKHYENGDRLFRLVANNLGDGDWERSVFFPAPLAATLEKDYPEVELAARISPGGLFGGGTNPIRRTDQSEVFFEEGFLLADPKMLTILEVPMRMGDRTTALAEPGSMVIARSKAERYFPGEDPIGKSMMINNDPEQTYTIGGVMEDFSAHHHLQPVKFLLSMKGVEFWPGEQGYWRANNYHTYLRLQPGTEVASLEKKLLTLIDNYYIPSSLAEGVKDAEAQERSKIFSLQPLSEIYLESGNLIDLLPHGDIRFVRLLGAVVLFILLLAVINFVNLSTAKSTNRAREVGMRKVVGSQRGQLIQQFLTESVIISGLSLLLGVGLAALFLPMFNELADKQLVLPWTTTWFVPGLLLGGLLLGVLSGFYPALFLSAFKPIDVLRGHLSRGAKSSGLRNTLVVFQFATSVVLLIGTMVIYQQMEFIFNTKLGFDKEQVLLLEGTNTLGDQLLTFKEEISRLPSVRSASISDYLPVEGTQRNSNRFRTEGDQELLGQFWLVDHDYLETLGMKIIAGRTFSSEMATDSTAVIINEAMARELNYNDPLGKRISNGEERHIIGVVEDFHYTSLKEKIFPLCLALGNSNSMVSIKTSGGEMEQLLAQITPLWDGFSPDQALNYSFLDQEYATMYTDVNRTRDVFLSFALLAIFIACLGLFALSTFLAEQRHKEISTRKVLGASTFGIVRLLSQNFLFLVGISILIAFPLAWYIMQQWLADFTYRITLGWPVFVLAGLLSVGVALLTISFQTIRAARLNPVAFLR